MFIAYSPSAHTRRIGSSYLEVQVAMVLLAIGMAGLYSMTVVQTRQANLLRETLPAADTAALNQASTPWQRKLGVYASIEPTLVPAEPVLPNVYIEEIIDNQDPVPAMRFKKGPTDFWGWYSWGYFATFLGSAHYHYSLGNTGSWAQFRKAGLPPNEYEVFVTYPSFSVSGSAIPHRIYDGSTLRDVVPVDQSSYPSDLYHAGRYWTKLGVYTVNSGVLRVRLKDGPNSASYIMVDALLIRSRRPLDILSVTETANGGAAAVIEAAP
ncbi:MAG: hypothetical protein HKN47_04855 [Pirellulaceae bacterium]|nr:hypothetical protein [Pirellulaceae bacterium]